MRVMLMIKGDPEPGAAPGEELLAAMGRYNDELKTAGVFPESKQLIAGHWILQVPSMTRPWNGPSGPRSRRFPGSTPASMAPRARSRSVGCSSWRWLVVIHELEAGLPRAAPILRRRGPRVRR